MKSLESLKPHHFLIGAIAAILVWLVACGGQLPASLGGGALGNGSDPGGGGTVPPACSAAQGAPAPDASPDPDGATPGTPHHGCSRSDEGTRSHHGHGHHGHHRCGCRGHRHGRRRHHSDDDDRDQASSRGDGHDAEAQQDRVIACAPAAPSRA